MANLKPTTTGLSRVFLLEGQARVDHTPSFESCMRAGAIDAAFGDIEKIECPDPDQYGKFVEIGKVRGATSRPTTSLVSRYAVNLKSDLLRLARQGCAADVHIHFGICQDPSDFDDFEKVLIFEDVAITNYGTDDLGTLDSDGNANVDETADVSMKDVYELLPVAYARKADDVVTNEVVDMVICDSPSCGDCEDESDGCEKVFGVTVAAGGSPGTPPDVVFTVDKGVTWLAHDIDTASASDAASGVACFGVNLVVVSNDTNSIHYAPLADFTSTADPSFTEVTTGFVVSGEPNDIWSVGTYAFIVGDGGYIYGTDDPTTSVTALESGSLTTSNLNAVHAISNEFAVAVGDSGVVLLTENQTIWSEATRPVGVGVNLNCVWIIDEKYWWVGTSNGRLYYTLDKGVTWTEKTFPGSGAGVVRDIQFPIAGVGFLAHDNATPSGRILESINGGNSWVVAPRGTATLAANDRITALATCSHDPNFVVGGGLHDDGSDGFVVVGDA